MTPASVSFLLRLQQASSIHDAHELMADAVKAGATSDEVSQAISEWMSLQAAQVQQVVDLPPYTHTPVTTADGLRVVGWSGPAVPVADVPEDDGPSWIDPHDRCHNCGGWGTWTETLVGSNGRDEDVDYPCGACDATGIEP